MKSGCSAPMPRTKSSPPTASDTVDDQSQGIQLSKLRPLIEHWSTDYDWRKAEAKLNAIPQFITEIDGIDIHELFSAELRAAFRPLRN
jgi:hypothetical protein